MAYCRWSDGFFYIYPHVDGFLCVQDHLNITKDEIMKIGPQQVCRNILDNIAQHKSKYRNQPTQEDEKNLSFALHDYCSGER